MIYLLDASVLITANDTYYPTTKVPEFWGWIRHQGELGNVKVPLEIWEEITPGRREGDSFFDWIKNSDHKSALVLDEEVVAALVRTTLSDGYAADLTDQEMETVGRDPFLIAYARADLDGRCVVTAEVSKPAKGRQNRRIPDVCETFGVSWCSPFALYRSLDFRTGWNSSGA